MLETIANNEPPKEEVLVDRAETDNKITRVTGAFCVEGTITDIGLAGILPGNHKDDLIQEETLHCDEPSEQMCPMERIRRRWKNPDPQFPVLKRELSAFHGMPDR